MAKRSELDKQVVRLNKRLARDSEYAPGHIFLDHAACYGGYRLEEVFNDGGAVTGFACGGTSARLSNQEMTTYLRGIHDALDTLTRRANMKGEHGQIAYADLFPHS